MDWRRISYAAGLKLCSSVTVAFCYGLRLDALCLRKGDEKPFQEYFRLTIMTMSLGNYEHKKRFCRMLMDTHRTDDPERFPWPSLDDDSLARMRSISLWSAVLTQQQFGSQCLEVYTPTIRDPLMKEAIAVFSVEHHRHTEGLGAMCRTYGLAVPSAGPLSRTQSPEAAFINFGFENNLDFFLACGLFSIVQQTCYLPETLLDQWNTLLDEKARHVVFFINWWAYWNLKLKHKKNWSEGRGFRAFWSRRGVLLGLLGTCDQEDFEEGTSSLLKANRLLGDLTKTQFLDLCSFAYGERMRSFDPNLVRPQLPSLGAQFLHRLLQFWPQRVGN